MGFVRFSEQTAIISLNSYNQLISVMETQFEILGFWLTVIVKMAVLYDSASYKHDNDTEGFIKGS